MALKRGMAAALALSCALLLTGCSSLLENPYAVVEPHTERPATAEDSSAVQAGTYSELVNTVLFFVSQGTEKGLIQLTDDYDGDVEEDLNRACLEVAKDDPLGAYAVDFIKNDCTKVLTTYEATITISYRRTREQIRSLVNVTGTSAIRDEVRAALADFQSEVALRVGYFTESADSIAALVRQAYYDEPAGALGMPEFTVSLYPASGGQQRIVEILLTYPEDTQALRQKSDDLQSTADALVLPLRPHQLSPSARQAELFSLVREHVRARPDGGPTAWDALLGGQRGAGPDLSAPQREDGGWLRSGGGYSERRTPLLEPAHRRRRRPLCRSHPRRLRHHLFRRRSSLPGLRVGGRGRKCGKFELTP